MYCTSSSSSIPYCRFTSLRTSHNPNSFAFSLVNDVFGKDQDRVQMEKVMMLLWQFRDDPTVVQFMAQFVAKVSVWRALRVARCALRVACGDVSTGAESRSLCPSRGILVVRCICRWLSRCFVRSIDELVSIILCLASASAFLLVTLALCLADFRILSSIPHRRS